MASPESSDPTSQGMEQGWAPLCWIAPGALGRREGVPGFAAQVDSSLQFGFRQTGNRSWWRQPSLERSLTALLRHPGKFEYNDADPAAGSFKLRTPEFGTAGADARISGVGIGSPQPSGANVGEMTRLH